MTGRYHPRAGVRGVSTGQERLNFDEKMLAHVFKAAGYATGAFGQWHGGSPWPYPPNARHHGVTVHRDGTLFISDNYNDRASKIVREAAVHRFTF